MTQEDKELLLKDISARFPYGVVLDIDTVDWRAPQGHIQVKIDGYGFISKDLSLIVNGSYYGDNYKPYLRPMSSMTEEEKEELIKNFWGSHTAKDTFEELSWYLSKHLDVNGLIPKGLAIEVTEENNPYED